MDSPCFVIGLVIWVGLVVFPTVKTGWSKGRQVLKSLLIGAVSAGLALWLLSMVVLQVVTRSEENASFKQAMQVTGDYIYGGIFLFAIVGGIAGGLFMLLWHEDEGETSGGKKKKSKSKKS